MQVKVAQLTTFQKLTRICCNRSKKFRQHMHLIIFSNIQVKVIYMSRSSTCQCHLHVKVIYMSRSSTCQGYLQVKVIYMLMLSSGQGHLHVKVIFRSRSSSGQGQVFFKLVKVVSKGTVSVNVLHIILNCKGMVH